METNSAGLSNEKEHWGLSEKSKKPILNCTCQVRELVLHLPSARISICYFTKSRVWKVREFAKLVVTKVFEENQPSKISHFLSAKFCIVLNTKYLTPEVSYFVGSVFVNKNKAGLDN